MVPTCRAGRRGAAAAGTALAAAAVGHALPSVTVLGTFLPRPPCRLPGGWCRWRLDGGHRAVALTFDDGPTPEATPRTLDLLDDLRLVATFFVVGAQVEAHPDLVAAMGAAGHGVAVHGHEHASHLVRSPQWVRRDTERAVAAVTEAAGVPPRWYRPPYGQIAAATGVQARRHGMEVVLWSRWGREFAEPAAGPVLDRLAGGLRPGAVLLLHDSDAHAPAGTAARTHQVLPLLAEALRHRGLGTVGLAAR